MRWIVGLLLLVVCLGQALGQETPVAEPESIEALVYDQVVLRFNSNIKNFPSWAAFKKEVLSELPLETMGTCYEPTNDAQQSVNMTMVPFQGFEEGRWQETADYGWRLFNKRDRTFIEYRVNTEASLLLRLEGVKPRFFFGYTKRICEFPL